MTVSPTAGTTSPSQFVREKMCVGEFMSTQSFMAKALSIVARCNGDSSEEPFVALLLSEIEEVSHG